MSRLTLPATTHGYNGNVIYRLCRSNTFAYFDHYHGRISNILPEYLPKTKKAYECVGDEAGEKIIVFYYCIFFFLRFSCGSLNRKVKPRGLRDLRCNNAQQIRINNIWRLSPNGGFSLTSFQNKNQFS